MNGSDILTILGNMTSNCTAVRVRVINRAITSIYDEALRPFGIKTSQLNILVAVAAFGRVRPGDVCRVLHLDPSTLSRNVERMRKKGWLIVTPDRQDGRTHTLAATPEGLRLVEKAYPAWEKGQADAAALLGIEGLKNIMHVGDGLMGLSSSER